MADRPLASVTVPIVESVAGAHVLVTGVEGYRIHIIGLALTAAGTVQLTFQDDTTSLMDVYMQAGQSFVLPTGNPGWVRSRA